MKKMLQAKYAVYLPTIGLCKPMHVINESIKNYLVLNGHAFTDDLQGADYIILNTCGAINEGEKASVDKYRLMLQVKEKQTQIIIIGCLPKINLAAFRELPVGIIIYNKTEDLDAIFKNKLSYAQAPKLAEPINNKNWKVLIPEVFLLLKIKFFAKILRKLFFLKRLQALIDSAMIENRNLIEISTGCTEFCSYCAIKKAKGGLKSNNPKQILQAIAHFKKVEQQVLTLVAQDCGSYGLDIKTNVFKLLESINQSFWNIPIEVSNLHPRWLLEQGEAWAEAFRRYNIVEIVIPLQAGSQKILKKMCRNYDLKKAKQNLYELKRLKPRTLFRTHLIVGFPGESWWDFLQNFKVIHWFDLCLVFPYQDRPNTASNRMLGKKHSVIIWLRWKLLSTYTLIVGAIKIIRPC